MKIFKKIKVGYHLMKVMLNPDKNIVSLIKVGDAISESKANMEAANKLFDKYDLENNFKSRKGLESFCLEKLEQMPVGSLGNELFHFFTKNKLDVYPMQVSNSMTKTSYLSERTRKLHDPLHVLMGFGIDHIGEAKVNAFVMAQTKLAVSSLILCVLILRFFFLRPFDFVALIDGIQEGWKEGKRSKMFLTIDWEQKMHLPIELLRKELALYPSVIKEERIQKRA